MFKLPKNKIYTTLAAFVLAILSLILFFVYPLWLEVKNNSKKLLSEKNEAAMLIAQSDDVENFKKVYDSYKPDLEKINQLFVDPQNPVEFIKFLEDTAFAFGIMSKISLVPVPESQEKPDTVSFQIFFNDDFLKILHFIEKLENGPYLIQIQNASIKSAGSDASGRVDASFLVNAFTKQ